MSATCPHGHTPAACSACERAVDEMRVPLLPPRDEVYAAMMRHSERLKRGEGLDDATDAVPGIVPGRPVASVTLRLDAASAGVSEQWRRRAPAPYSAMPAPAPAVEAGVVAALVAELAASEPLYVFTTHTGVAAKRCALCGEVTAYEAPTEHRETCLWVRACAAVGR